MKALNNLWLFGLRFNGRLAWEIGLSHVKIEVMETKPVKPNDIIKLSPSLQRHKKQRFWQILAPVLLGSMITLAAAVLMILALTGDVSGINLSQVADTSLIWLILPVVIFGVVFGMIILGMIYTAARLLNVLPHYTFLFQQYAALVEAKIKLWTKKGMDPVITVESVKSAVSAFFKNLLAWAKK